MPPPTLIPIRESWAVVQFAGTQLCAGRVGDAPIERFGMKCLRVTIPGLDIRDPTREVVKWIPLELVTMMTESNELEVSGYIQSQVENLRQQQAALSGAARRGPRGIVEH